MKKLSTVLAACMFAGFVSAQVESQNVVGYSSVAIGATKPFMLGSNFEKVTTTTGEGVTFSSLVPSIGFEDFDNIQVGVANALGVIEFTSYLYLTFNDPVGWYLDDGVTYAGNEPLPAGAAVWMVLASSQNVTANGQVRKSSTAFSFEANKATMTSSAYPIPFNPNNCVWTGTQDFDNIQVGLADEFGVLQFTSYLYLTFNDPVGWYLDDGVTYAGDIAPVGAGFWVLMQGAVGMTQASPL